jgi:hypothetical protein
VTIYRKRVDAPDNMSIPFSTLRDKSIDLAFRTPPPRSSP